ncbi:MAG: flippase-like domain-containing protein [Cytophagales bacterium]|nr:flippase-like domain-containing protein [Cytophagales bacterium]
MSNSIKNILKYAVMLFVTAFLLWFSFKSIETQNGQSKFDFILETWDRGNKGFLFLSAFLAVMSHFVRAIRWHIILKPLGYKPSVMNSFTSVMLGYFVNLVIPRGGELSRCATLYKLEKIPIKTSLGTVIAERVIDLVLLIVCVGTVFLIKFQKFWDFFANLEGSTKQGETSYLKYYVLGAMVLCTVIAYWYLRRNLRLLVKVKGFLVGIKEGLVAIFRLEQRVLFLVYSMMIWACYYFMAYTVFLAYPETANLGLDAALTIFVLGGIAMVAPLPGGTGSYHLIVSRGLNLFYGITTTSAMAFATIFHGWQTLVIIIVGGICGIIFLSKTKNQAIEENEHKN